MGEKGKDYGDATERRELKASSALPVTHCNKEGRAAKSPNAVDWRSQEKVEYYMEKRRGEHGNAERTEACGVDRRRQCGG